MAADRIRTVIQDLVRTGSVVDAKGVERSIFPVALGPAKAAVLRDWVLREAPAHTIEVGLAYGFSALHICEALVLTGRPDVRHVVIDPNQLTGYASAGLRVLERAGVTDLVEFHAEESQLLLPRLAAAGRCFDLAFVDGNHRFDYVFVDLFFLRRLVRRGGIVVLDDYNLPGIRRAAAFFVTNTGWTLETTAVDDQIVVLRTAATPDSRDFRFFADF